MMDQIVNSLGLSPNKLLNLQSVVSISNLREFLVEYVNNVREFLPMIIKSSAM
jgi:hypothetical protein